MSTAIKWIMAASLIGAIGTANAQETYDYSGSNFDVVSGLYTTSDSVQGSFMVPSALAANLYQEVVIPSSYAFSDGVQTILNGGDFGFSISTNASGQIYGWNIAVHSPSNGGILINWQDISLGVPDQPSIYDLVENGVENSFATSDHAGVWTAHMTAPEIDPASAASGLTLLAGVLAVLRSRRPQRLAAQCS